MSADCGLIILGNSGVGKSFLANILLGEEKFVHKFSPGSVTTETKHADTVFGGYTFAVFDIPGLIEAEQDKIDRNKREIDRAFAQQPNSLILFVLGEQGGRIRDEDIVAFQAINKAYTFKTESLVLIVNNLPKDRDDDYEGATITYLKEKIKLSFTHIAFVDRINKKNRVEHDDLRKKILNQIKDLTPNLHRKEDEIEVKASMVAELKRAIKEMNDQFEAQRQQYRDEINRQQEEYQRQLAAQMEEIKNLQEQVRNRPTGEGSSVSLRAIHFHHMSKEFCFCIWEIQYTCII